MTKTKSESRNKYDLYKISEKEWTDAELIEQLTERYKESEIPPCCICGKALSMQSVGGGEPTRWACVGRVDSSGKCEEGRTFCDEHYSRSFYVDRRQGGDSGVMELIRRYQSLEQRSKRST